MLVNSLHSLDLTSRQLIHPGFDSFMGPWGDRLLCFRHGVSSDYADWDSPDSTPEFDGGCHGSSWLIGCGAFCRSTCTW